MGDSMPTIRKRERAIYGGTALTRLCPPYRHAHPGRRCRDRRG